VVNVVFCCGKEVVLKKNGDPIMIYIPILLDTKSHKKCQLWHIKIIIIMQGPVLINLPGKFVFLLFFDQTMKILLASGRYIGTLSSQLIY
jgi:hypothetical protein